MISGRDNHGEQLEVESYERERVHKFEYSSVRINGANHNHNEIKTRTTAESKCYRGLASVQNKFHVNKKLHCTQ